MQIMPEEGGFIRTPSEVLRRGKWGPARLVIDASINDDASCIEWCKGVRLIASERKCPKHHTTPMVWAKEARPGGGFWRCNKCKNQGTSSKISLFKGSIFEDSSMTPGKILLLLCCCSKGLPYDITQDFCRLSADDTEVSSATISSWYKYLRKMVVEWATKNPILGDKIGGPGSVVQIDEAKFGKRKGNVGRCVDGKWIIGMVASNGDLRFQVLVDNLRDSETLFEAIVRNVEFGSEIHTDGWLGYSCLDKRPSPYASHRVVNHSIEFVAADGTHTQRIESQWRALRRKMGSGGIPNDDNVMAEHLTEYLWRRYCHRSKIDEFAHLCQILAAT